MFWRCEAVSGFAVRGLSLTRATASLLFEKCDDFGQLRLAPIQSVIPAFVKSFVVFAFFLCMEPRTFTRTGKREVSALFSRQAIVGHAPNGICPEPDIGSLVVRLTP